MENVLFRYAKVRDVESPLVSTDYSVGIDFFMPKFTMELVDEIWEKNKDSISEVFGSEFGTVECGFRIKPHRGVVIPSGLKIQIPTDKGLAFGNRSSVASKKLTIVGAFLIDPDYKNEMFFNLINVSDDYVTFNFGDKIVQGQIVNRHEITFEEVKEDELIYPISNRVGGCGSTGK